MGWLSVGEKGVRGRVILGGWEGGDGGVGGGVEALGVVVCEISMGGVGGGGSEGGVVSGGGVFPKRKESEAAIKEPEGDIPSLAGSGSGEGEGSGLISVIGACNKADKSSSLSPNPFKISSSC